MSDLYQMPAGRLVLLVRLQDVRAEFKFLSPSTNRQRSVLGLYKRDICESAKSAISGRHLLMAASLWLAAVLAWNQLVQSSFFLSLGKRNRTKIALVLAFGWFYQLFIFGWLAPLAIGIYRVVSEKSIVLSWARVQVQRCMEHQVSASRLA